MKLLEINVCSGKLSTGRIASDIAEEFIKNGNEAVIATSYDYKKTPCPVYIISDKKQDYIDGIRTRLFDNAGFNNKNSTIKFVEWIKKYNPDVIHLHNLHGYYINVEVLFNYLKTCNKKIIWTLHDCWAFTGHCTHFEYAGCNKWIDGCNHCNRHREYPKSVFFDRSKKNYKLKKKLFTGVDNLTIVTPSQWLAGLVKKSFLKEYPLVVINNGIDLNIFKKTDSNLRERYNLVEKKIILAVAGVWDHRKGYDDVLKLSQLLNDSMRIVMIGLNEKQLKSIPFNVLGIKKTDSVQELVQWYSIADVLINPTYEDNYPTVNLEAQACGCPVITYKTGGSVESVIEENVVNCCDIFSLFSRIRKILIDKCEIVKPSSIYQMIEKYINLCIR